MLTEGGKVDPGLVIAASVMYFNDLFKWWFQYVMLAKTYGSAVYGVNAFIITIEVDVGQGTQFFMVGFPDSAVKESQQRVEAAIKFFNYHMPRRRL